MNKIIEKFVSKLVGMCTPGPKILGIIFILGTIALVSVIPLGIRVISGAGLFVIFTFFDQELPE